MDLLDFRDQVSFKWEVDSESFGTSFLVEHELVRCMNTPS